MLALQKLQECSDLPKSENKISARLAVVVRETAFSLGLDYPPKRELPRQPESEGNIGGLGADRRPDFTCEVRDLNATSFTDAWLYYHVECKCLGEPSSSTWIYNKNYVEKGIRRFLDPEYGYGGRAFSGAMIGYVLSTSLEQILDEVNGHLGGPSDLGSAPPIGFPDAWQDRIAKSSQELDRRRVSPRHFTLWHIWVDLRPRQTS